MRFLLGMISSFQDGLIVFWKMFTPQLLDVKVGGQNAWISTGGGNFKTWDIVLPRCFFSQDKQQQWQNMKGP